MAFTTAINKHLWNLKNVVRLETVDRYDDDGNTEQQQQTQSTIYHWLKRGGGVAATMEI